ncbi:MAG TPA: tRNA (adenosine(37)-N6)-threonylcarbamoyltransferase complex dimerization subunit type 1 TsaB [Candidatus Binatia bacterium]|nr:tRNA (adenosine(37)-N6)-threonylcarbamoyltransferase complex dimerization subunit type 1 TsaB [Candidatus Binatia bacterium]
MRFILGIDTAGPRGSIALARDGEGSEPVRLPEGGHSSGLAPAIERLLAGGGLRVADLAGIAVSAGPGSFTGLRIGLAWAKGASLGAGIPLFMIPSHDAAAHAHRRSAPRFATLTQGERGHVMAALWDGCVEEGDDRARLLWGPEVVPEEDVLDRLRERAGADVPVAAATEALEEWVLDLGGTTLPAVPLGPAVAKLGAVALAAGAGADLLEAAPLYGRAPNARKPGAR